ncbi:hypothetical protein A0J61_08806 [Choanephora cucurbitarum]|uniref:Uncharacterized protein n=1 Tax=Choanephora cucurbitarum TaxID=101091 RepID=A0A1C7N743_9FUNG|nr:hypothetical protein A0J61_08806 [Choanephora cucurbitarum]
MLALMATSAQSMNKFMSKPTHTLLFLYPFHVQLARLILIRDVNAVFSSPSSSPQLTKQATSAQSMNKFMSKPTHTLLFLYPFHVQLARLILIRDVNAVFSSPSSSPQRSSGSSSGSSSHLN